MPLTVTMTAATGTASATSEMEDAPTWTPQSTQENWSHPPRGGNFIKAWGVPSNGHHRFSTGFSGRVMPKPLPAIQAPRCEELHRLPPLLLAVTRDVCRIELGPTRRDPLGPLSQEKPNSVLQGASAMGSFAVSSARECQPPGMKPGSTTFEFGVSVSRRPAHAHRAYVRSSMSCGFGCAYVEERSCASNHRRGHDTRRCSLQNELVVHSNATHGVNG